MRVSGRHWAMAFSAAVLVHIGVAAAILWQPPQSGAVGAGMGGIEVSLGPAGGAPGSEARPVEEAAEVAAVEVTDTAVAEPPSESATVPPPDPVTAQPIPPVETETAVPAEAPIAAAPAQDVAAIEVVEATPVESNPAEEAVARAMVAPPLPMPKPRPPQRETRPEPRAEAAPETAQPSEAPAEQAAVIMPPAPGADGRAGTQANPDAGSANDTSGGGMPGATADYMAVLQAWLERHKEYPSRAQRRRQEGTALLYFVMDRDGWVIEYRLEQSSGHDLLDREVAAMIERAQPLPRMPDDIRPSRLELVVPVQFFLR